MCFFAIFLATDILLVNSLAAWSLKTLFGESTNFDGLVI